MFYLDDPNERATAAILNQLKVKISFGSVPPSTKFQPWSTATSILSRERKSVGCDVSYSCAEGSALSVDIRDFADCWIRITLSVGDSVVIPRGLYHRVAVEPVRAGHACCSGSLNVGSSEDANSVFTYRYAEDSDSYAVPIVYHQVRELVCELCRQFFDEGWVTGTGGSISIRHGNRIYMTPSGVQKERIQPDELFVLDIDGDKLCVPPRKPGRRAPALSDCAPLFLHAFKQRNAGNVVLLL